MRIIQPARYEGEPTHRFAWLLKPLAEYVAEGGIATLTHERTNASLQFSVGPDLPDEGRQVALHLPAPKWQVHRAEAEARILAQGLSPEADGFPDGALFGIATLIQGSPAEIVQKAEALATSLFPLLGAEEGDLYTLELGGETTVPRGTWTDAERSVRIHHPALSRSEQRGRAHGSRFARFLKRFGF